MVTRNRDGCRAFGLFLLHDDMAAALARFHEPVFGKNGTYLFAGQHTEFTQRRPQLE